MLELPARFDEENPAPMKQVVDKGKKRQLEAEGRVFQWICPFSRAEMDLTDNEIAPLRPNRRQKQVALEKLVNKRKGGS